MTKEEHGECVSCDCVKKIKLYLGHSFNTRKEIRVWEQELEKNNGIKLDNPFYDVDRKDIENVDAGRAERYANFDHHEIVDRDVSKIHYNDGMVAIIKGKLSYGTPQEMVYSKLFGKPVYSLIKKQHQKDPWLVYHSTRLFTEIKELTEFLLSGLKNEELGQINEKQKSKSHNIIQQELKKMRRQRFIPIIIEEKPDYAEIQKMVYAHCMKKPVYTLVTNEHEEHPWLKYHSDEIFTNKKDFGIFLRGANAIHKPKN